LTLTFTLTAHRARRWLLLALALGTCAPAAVAARAAGATEPPPSRLRLVRLGQPMAPGQRAVLRIETLDQGGKPRPTHRPLEVSLTGVAGLTATSRVTVPAGSAGVDVPIEAKKAGLWQIDARAEGLYSASTVIVCVQPATLARHQDVARTLQKTVATSPAAAGERSTARAPVGPLAPTGARAPSSRPMPSAPPGLTLPAPAGAPVPAEAAAPAGAPAPRPGLATARRLPPAPSIAGTPSAPPAGGGQAGSAPPAHTEVERLVAEGTAPPAGPKPGSRPATLRAFATTGAARPTVPPVPPGAPEGGPGPAPGAGSAPGGDVSAGATPATAGSGVRLVPEHLERYRGTQGWESVAIDAYWYENGNPSPAPQQIDLELALVDDRGDLRIDPDRLSIPPGDFVSRQPAVVTAASARKASLQALYSHGHSNLVDVSFLAAPAARLAFASGPSVIRAFGVASSEVYVRLLDATGVPAVADQPIKVNLSLSGPTGSPQLSPAVINAGEFETRVPVQLPRFGTYSVSAAASNLADAAPLSIEVAFDWLLLLSALLGGLLGSLTRVLYQAQGGSASPRHLLRVLLLGGLAALLTVLLSAFGLLSLLAGSLPQGWSESLARIPLGSLTGVFLLGFLAGLLFDRVLGGLLTPARGRAAAPQPEPPPGH
jgi:hypothetical protein